MMKINSSKIIKKISLISFWYGVLYYFAVYKVFAVTGKWHWNLLLYFGKINFCFITVCYFSIMLYATKGKKGT